MHLLLLGTRLCQILGFNVANQPKSLPTPVLASRSNPSVQLAIPVLWRVACSSSRGGSCRPACRWSRLGSAHVRPSSCPGSPQTSAPRLHRLCDTSPPSVTGENGERGQEVTPQVTRGSNIGLHLGRILRNLNELYCFFTCWGDLTMAEGRGQTLHSLFNKLQRIYNSSFIN